MIMNKVLDKVYVPLNEEKYDVFIPLNKKICNVIKLLAKAIYELTDGNYNPDTMPTLYDKATVKPYNMTKNVKESNIKNGTELILM